MSDLIIPGRLSRTAAYACDNTHFEEAPNDGQVSSDRSVDSVNKAIILVGKHGKILDGQVICYP